MPPPTQMADALLAQRRAFKAFLVARLGSEADAEDVLQTSLLKAWQHGGELRALLSRPRRPASFTYYVKLASGPALCVGES